MNGHKVHDLKVWTEYFKALKEGKKTFEVRKNDRDFKVGDVLNMHEFDTERGYIGKSIIFSVIYILHGGQFGIEEGYCVMSLEYLR